LNQFPILSHGGDVVVSPGQTIVLTSSATDADGDALHFSETGPRFKTFDSGLFRPELLPSFPQSTGSALSFLAPPLSRVATLQYFPSVADGRGGGAVARNLVTVTPTEAPAFSPTATLSVSPTSANVGETITINFPITTTGGPASWELSIGGFFACCFTGPTLHTAAPAAGVFRFSARAMDQQLNLSERSTVIVSVGGATGIPPKISAKANKLSGPVPLTVTVDLSQSFAQQNGITVYGLNCGENIGVPTTSAVGSCTFADPGPHTIGAWVKDGAGNADATYLYVMATATADTAPPLVRMTSPAPHAALGIATTLEANASDMGSGIMRVEFHLDSATGALLATTETSPYRVTWDSSALWGAHTIFARAFDNAGNSASASVPVLAVPPPPAALFANNTGCASITATWWPSNGASSYRISRASHQDGPFFPTSVTGTSHVDIGLTPGATYYYLVTAVNAAGESLTSPEASAVANGCLCFNGICQ
jgi:hypothetical protein